MSQFPAHFPVLSSIVEDIVRQRAKDSGSPTTPHQTQKAKITGDASHVSVGKSAPAIAQRRQRRQSKPFRLHVLGDLHLEFGPRSIPKPDADVVVLAGDVHVGTNGLEWIRQQFPDRPVLYVLGNHEFYRQSLPELTEILKRESVGTNIHVLENSAVELHGFTFLGCTMWSSFEVGPNPKTVMQIAEAQMNDYHIIRNSIENRALRAADTAKLHRESVTWLQNELRRHDPRRTIVVTHHGPSQRSESPAFVGGSLSPAFVSNLDAVVENSGAPLWIHGHTHYNVDYRIGSTRVLSNQFGYPNEPCKDFDPALVVELGSTPDTVASARKR